MRTTIWVGELKGSTLVYDPEIQIPECSHIFLWDPSLGKMREFVANIVREHIIVLDDQSVDSKHIEQYKKWYATEGEKWRKEEWNYYESRQREEEEKKLEDKRQEEQEALRKIEEAKRQKLIEEQKIQGEVEEKEFEQLVAEMKPLGLIKSKDVSWHIMSSRLGYKYKNISGIVKMEQDGTSWNFKGGFPPVIYARLCEELGLSNQGTRARVVGFKPFKDL